MPDGFRIRTFTSGLAAAPRSIAQRLIIAHENPGLSETSCIFEIRRGGRNTLSSVAA
jgi:hypothetical protein